MESNYVSRFILNVINKINEGVIEHKYIECRFFWRNFKIWNKLLFETKTKWFQEWYFLWHVKNSNNDIYKYDYKILNMSTWKSEQHPIYNITKHLT